ncbi:MAG: FISUMP domain-containing protein, partial [Candidatus Saccharibacteria bacterium]|nr:FISUMP domain-containing protein [Candidatus Saccharibacteria bacterium]
ANLYSYGNYYNWYSATAGRGTYSTGANVTTAGDLCPTGWHLPTGHSTSAAVSGEFGLLSNSLGGYKNASDVAQTMYSSTTPTAAIMAKRLRHFPNNFLHSGDVNGASLSSRGSNGYYWSSTADSSSSAYSLYFCSSSVYPGTYSSDKYSGRTVRCLVSPGA